MNGVIRILPILLLGAGLSGPVAAQLERADPLLVPMGSGQTPEQLADLHLQNRVEKAEKGLRDRGYSEMPLLALALLERADRSPNREEARVLMERAVELAPATPSVRFKAGRLSRSPTEFAMAGRAVFLNLPALHWLAVLLGGASGFATLVTSIVVVIVAFARAVPLHGHRFGHLTAAQDPPAWPGVLLAIGVLSVLPLLGMGPIPVVALAGLLAAMRMRPAETAHVALALVVCGVTLGPGLSVWARLVALPSDNPALLAAWRIDQAQPLPRDRDELIMAVKRDPKDLLLRVALATAWKREGDLDRAQETLEDFSGALPRPLESRALNLQGSIHLARGNIEPAVRAFEAAKSLEESAAFLYNLSQAHGRGLRLINQSAYFKQARNLDPDLISLYNQKQSSNLHRYLIDSPIPPLDYLKRGLRPSLDAELITVGIRNWTLGTRAPEWAWMLLPALGLLALFLRSSSIWRCARCERPVCSRCAPAAAGALNCPRCERLFGRRERSDPRVRRRQLELDRQRQRRIARTLALMSFFLPGLAQIYEGRVSVGGLKVFLVATAGVLLLSVAGWTAPVVRTLPAPLEMAEISDALQICVALALLIPLYLGAVVESVRRRSAGFSA
jgi:tetratricopeptide (TPR) repeat protein